MRENGTPRNALLCPWNQHAKWWYYGSARGANKAGRKDKHQPHGKHSEIVVRNQVFRTSRELLSTASDLLGGSQARPSCSLVRRECGYLSVDSR